MSNADLENQVAAAKAYESLFVPALFKQWTARVADEANVMSGARVLDVACGTGVLAREVLARTGPTGYVVGLDPGVGMLAVAKELGPAMDWRQGVAESIPFADESFDAVVSQFGLMFMDPNQAIHEMLRVLKPEGRLVVAVWDAVQNIPAYSSLVDVLERFGGTPAADALRAPFVLGDRQLLVDLFKQAGASSVNINTSKGTADFPSIRVMVEADLRGWLPLVGVHLTEDVISNILEESEQVLGPFVTADGRVTFDMPAHLVTARK